MGAGAERGPSFIYTAYYHVTLSLPSTFPLGNCSLLLFSFPLLFFRCAICKARNKWFAVVESLLDSYCRVWAVSGAELNEFKSKNSNAQQVHWPWNCISELLQTDHLVNEVKRRPARCDFLSVVVVVLLVMHTQGKFLFTHFQHDFFGGT